MLKISTCTWIVPIHGTINGQYVDDALQYNTIEMLHKYSLLSELVYV